MNPHDHRPGDPQAFILQALRNALSARPVQSH